MIETLPADLAAFLGLPLPNVEARLARGFHPAHAEVAEDFRAANPTDSLGLLRWYSKTEAYLWELSAYHRDVGFNYLGMCRGIAAHCRAFGLQRVLCLGDGIGTLSLVLAAAGLEPVYHDLLGSTTAAFAQFRFLRAGAQVHRAMTVTFEPWPSAPPPVVDAAVALDFLEHVPNVPEWCMAMKRVVRPDGWFLAQNAFGIGSPDREGSIPCHLAENTHWETDWVPLMGSLGFRAEPGGWWRT